MKNSAIVCEKRIYTETVTSHHHTHGQFLFPLHGSMDLKTAGHQVNLTPEYCFYLAPYTDHVFHSSEQNEFLVLDIPVRILPGSTNDMYEAMDAGWSAIKYLLTEEVKQASDSAALLNLTNYITNKLKTATPPSIEHINKNFKQRLSLEMLAQIENYHPAYYSKWFKNQTGKSVKEYINELRIEEARYMLIGTDWPITRIAGEMDFEIISSFTRWFVKNEGVSPHEFRNLKKR